MLEFIDRSYTKSKKYTQIITHGLGTNYTLLGMSRITAVKSSNVGFFQYDRLFSCPAVLIKGEFLEPNNKTKRLDNKKKMSSKDNTKIKFAVGNGLLVWCHCITRGAQNRMDS